MEGGTWIRSKYTSGSGISKQCRKHAFAVIDGWSVIRVTTDMIRGKSREALSLIQQLLETKRRNR